MIGEVQIIDPLQGGSDGVGPETLQVSGEHATH